MIFSGVPGWQASALVSMASFMALLIVAMLLDAGAVSMRKRSRTSNLAAAVAAALLLPIAFCVSLYYLIYVGWVVLLVH